MTGSAQKGRGWGGKTDSRETEGNLWAGTEGAQGEEPESLKVSQGSPWDRSQLDSEAGE